MRKTTRLLPETPKSPIIQILRGHPLALDNSIDLLDGFLVLGCQ
jgi:hypothetical protein